MTTGPQHGPQLLPVANYSSIIAKAIEWLGDGYLLRDPWIQTASVYSALFNILGVSRCMWRPDGYL